MRTFLSLFLLKVFLHSKMFQMNLQKWESFSVLTEILSLMRVAMSMVCGITTTLEPVVVQYATSMSVMWKLER